MPPVLKMLSNALENIKTIIGGDLSVIVLGLAKALISVGKAFTSLPVEIRYTIEGFLAFAAVLGPITYIFGAILIFSHRLWNCDRVGSSLCFS